jgi:FkbM family methyltransferase
MKSYSQLKQDIEVITLYNKKTNGYFVEIGAYDGIDLSNTYLLETQYNWKGICVEPIPAHFEKLVKNRPSSICFQEAIYKKSGLTLNFDIADQNNMLSGISNHIDKHKSVVDLQKTTIQVKTMTLLDLLDKANAPHFIEYLSLDTEGSELEILKPFDYNKYIFGVIHVEHNFIEPRRSQIKELLLSKGYKYVSENHWDDFYIHKSI